MSELDITFAALADVGMTPAGRDCLAYSAHEDLAHRQAVALLTKLGCEIAIDKAKNLYATWYPDAASKSKKVVAVGSHLDSVPQGGRYDGVLGVAAGIEALRRVQVSTVPIAHPIQVIAFRAEESSRFKQAYIGSSIAAGVLETERLKQLKDEAGITLLSILGMTESRAGELLTERWVSPERMQAYFEMHIEQSSVIESVNREEQSSRIGVVTGGIGGSYRARLTLTGMSFHSGGLPMHLRHDRDMAVAAAEIILAVKKRATEFDTTEHAFRATVNIENLPGKAVNAGSGKECLLLDARGIEESSFRANIQALHQIARDITERYAATLEITELSYAAPTPFGSELPEIVRNAAQHVGVPFIELPSMPGHDAASVAKAGVPVGMIFVESRAGESHNNTEYTSPEQMELGVQVLTQALITAASR